MNFLMGMKILNLNCQKGEQPMLESFLRKALDGGSYDFLLLQEVDAKVLAFLQHPSYALLRVFNEETGQDSQLCIAYRKTCRLSKSGFKSLSFMRYDPVRGFKHPAFGVLWADFEIGGKMIRVASVHLHSGTDRHIRLAEMEMVKKILLEGDHLPTAVTGDFNAGWPGECDGLARVFAPEFSWMTKELGPTLDSRYSENVAHITNRVAAFLGIFNIGIRLRTDHAFLDSKTAGSYSMICSILPDRVSDHSPVECMIDFTQEAPIL